MKQKESKPDALVLLREFTTEIEAFAVKNRLEAEEIPSFLFNENLNSVGAFLYSGFAPVRLMVMYQHLETAKKILSEVDAKK